MAIGIDELDYDEYEVLNTTQDVTPVEPENTEEELDDRGVISEFLKSKGIQDISKIKYEGEDEQEEEVDWDNLDSSEKLAILQQLDTPSNDLDDAELQLINTIRSSKMSPSEYLNYITKREIDKYASSLQGENYEIDQYSDDDLYITDFISRMGKENVTTDEAQEALDRAKSNEALFKKQVAAMRNEYKKIEDQNRQYEVYLREQQMREQYNQFANAIRDQVANFNEFQGYDLNMDQEDKAELYDFITGLDEAGNSVLGKAMNDPSILVKMAWFALHGEQMLDDISDYMKQQVTKVRKDSYNQGVEDARNGQIKDKKPVTTYKPKKPNSNAGHMTIDDLD